jgi:2'-hydroxyisoflavone reductase
MQILIIGGGIFVGRALIEAALAQGHQVTAFSRGNSPLPRADEIQSILGDRHQDLSALTGQHWDAVIDTCAYRPEDVTALHAAIGSQTGHYTLISSISAYADKRSAGLTESSPLAAALANPGPGVTPENYGPLKAEAERAAAVFAQTLIIRPGIIAGPYDPTDRFTYWVDLIGQLTDLVVPVALPDSPVQIIDARDLASWLIKLIEAQVTGAFNAVGPQTETTLQSLLTAIARSLGRPLKLHPKTDDALVAAGADPTKDFPLFIPVDAAFGGLFQVDGQKAWASGLTNRAVAATAQDTAAWFNQNRSDPPKVGWPAKQMAAAS